MQDESIYFRQLLAGQQVAQSNPAAGQMANFMYLVGDPDSREALIVDPAWDVQGLLDQADQDDYRIVGALISHYHPDHIGGDLYGMQVEGIARLLERSAVPLYVNKHEAEGVKIVSGVSESDLKRVDDGETITVGKIPVQFLHTPGHTPGSQCFLIGNRLVAGDTLFVRGCGRVDLPGGDPEQLYYSLTRKLAKLPPDTILFPGHDYGPTPTSTIAEELEHNHYLRIRSLDDWRRMMGGF